MNNYDVDLKYFFRILLLATATVTTFFWSTLLLVAIDATGATARKEFSMTSFF